MRKGSTIHGLKKCWRKQRRGAGFTSFAAWALAALFILAAPPSRAASVTIDGSQTNQVIDGFGVNANYYSWANSELIPALDALIDGAGMTLFRVIFNNGWETNNDNSDPNVMNWAYYNALYSGPEFQKLWSMMAHLNQKGITNGLVLNFQGPGPSWMGGWSLTPGMEAEWAEMVASLVIYARTNRHLQFTLLAPNNEPNNQGEGIQVQSASQYVTSLNKLAQLLDANGISDIRFVAPDLASGLTDFFPEIMADPLVMSKMAHFGIHSYSAYGDGSQGVYDFVTQAGYPDRTVWVTEYNVWCSVCEAGTQGTNDWDYSLGTAQYLSGHLDNNVSAGLVWEAYDSYYPHHGRWSFWGLLAVSDINAVPKLYTPRQNFYTLAQFAKFVRPGARRIGASSLADPLSLQAFYHDTSGQLSIVGFNTGGTDQVLSGTLASLPPVASLDLYYTTSSTNLYHAATTPVIEGAFSVTVPADSIFTLTGFDPAKLVLSVSLTSPTNGARYIAPAAISIRADASTTTGSMRVVEFFNGATKLGQATAPPYSMTWSNVAPGIYSLSARASNSVGNVLSSDAALVTVVGPFAQVSVVPTIAEVSPGGTQQFTATALDALGSVLNIQPAFSWSVNGGGTITSNGVLTATNGTGGPFLVQASASNIWGVASFTLATNLAQAGTGYTWYTLASPSANSPSAAAPGINDGDLATDVHLLPGTGEDSANVYEAGGVLWGGTQTVARVVWNNGTYLPNHDGVFAADLRLQFTGDGVTWSDAGPEWTLSQAYPYNLSAAGDARFEFSGGLVSVGGVRCVGQVHTSPDPTNSWVAIATEVEAYTPTTLLAPAPAMWIDNKTNGLAISWGGWAGNYLLESSTNLGAPTSWSTVTNTPQPNGQNWQVTVARSVKSRFFRLRLP